MHCEGSSTYWFYFQVVRYHSLVIEPGSLPDDLISIAWTASPNLLSYLESDRTNVCTFLAGPALCFLGLRAKPKLEAPN